MKKILFITLFFVSIVANAQFIVTGSTSAAPSGATTTVANLSQLQALTPGDVASITSEIDLANTDVTISSGVTLLYGGASIISSGTGELLMSANSFIDPLLLNYQLNFDTTSAGLLTNANVMFWPETWGITRTADMTGTIIWSNTTARDEAINNGLRFEKFLSDVKLLGGSMVSLGKLDMYFGLGHYADIIEDTVQDANYRAGVVDVPSGIHIKMDNETYIRQYPHYNYAGALLELYDKDNIIIEGGNLIGERDTHLYRNILIVSTIPTSSPVRITVRDDSGVGGGSVTYNVTVTIAGATDQSIAEEIRDFLIAQYPTWTVTAALDPNTNDWAVYTDNNTPGRGLEIEPASDDASGGSYAFGNNRHEQAHGIYLIGAKNVTIRGVRISYFVGDNIASVGKSSPMTFEANSENILIEQCILDYGRRMNIAANSVENMTIQNCIITNGGQSYNSNRGTEPASNVWFEPFRSRAANGTLTENSIARRIVVKNNRILDASSASVGLYTTYDALIEGNLMNNTVSFDFGEQNHVINNTIDLSYGSFPSTAAIDFDSRDDGGFNFTREIPTHNIISGNIIKGDTTAVAQGYGGISVQGYKTIIEGNIIRNMGAYGISVGTLTDSKVSGNMILTDPELDGTFERGIVMTSSDAQNLTINENYIYVGGSPLRFTSINDGIQTGYGQRYNKTIVRGNHLESSGDIIDVGAVPINYMQGPNNTEFDGNVFYDRVYFNGGGNDSLVIKNNTFKSDLYFNGTNQDQEYVKIINNIFEDDGTTNPNLDMETRGGRFSNNIDVIGNIAYKASGTNAFLIRETSTGQNNTFHIGDNTAIGGVTNAVNFTGSGSYIWNNTNRGVSSQSVTLGNEGTANTVN